MPSSKRDAEDLRALCEQTYPDDGVNPRDDKKRDAVRTNKHDRKLQQLCKQVESAMQLALPNIDLPCAARIWKVVPAPDAGRLGVIVAISDDGDHRQVATCLEHCKGYLRCEVAQMVSRRRIPELIFSTISEGVIDE